MQEQSSSWWQRHWSVLLLGLLVAVLTGAGFRVLHIAWGPTLLFALLFALEAIFLWWTAKLSSQTVRHKIEQLRAQRHHLLWQAMYVVLGCILCIAYISWFRPTNMWHRTLVYSLFLGCIGYGLMIGCIQFMVQTEQQGRLRMGFAESFFSRSTQVLWWCAGVLILIVFNFLGGIHWWYARYVTPKMREKVQQRNQILRSIQLTKLADRHEVSLGVYSKKQSDWATYYNAPNILEWKISRVLMLSEGDVQTPPWWWRYLPDGERLKTEPFSFESFLRMPYYMLKQNRKVGGSTPTLQAAKNFYDFGKKRSSMGLLSTVRTKLFEEMPRSYVMSQLLSPPEMMAIYQATLWSGQGDHYGLHRMAYYYYNIPQLEALDWNQSVVIAAALPSPGRLNPWYLASCLKGKCKTKRQQRAHRVWKKRIAQLKRRLRARGIHVPKELPSFQNGIGQLKAISHTWKTHDVHIRNWIEQSMPTH
ncbi:MAG: transglycosylase domain-containing protein, partial [Myxococcota bacterium]